MTAGVSGGSMVARNFARNIAAQFVALAAAVVSIPITLHALGPDRFGVLSLTLVILGYFGMLDLGMGRATTKFAAELFGRGQDGDIPPLLYSAAAVQVTVGVVGGVVLWLATPSLVYRFLHVPDAIVPEAVGAFRIVALTMPVVTVTSSLRGLLEGAQRFDLVNLVRVPVGALTFLVPAGGATIGWGLPRILIGVAVVWTAAVAGYLACALKLVPALRRRPGIASHWLRPLFHFGGWLSVSSIATPILVNLDRFVLGNVLSLSAVAFYSVPHEIMTRSLVVPGAMVTALFPALATLSGAPQQRLLSRLAARSLRYIVLGVAALTILLVVFPGELLRLWVGSTVAAESANALRVLALALLVNSFALVPYSTLHALGRTDLPARFHLFELVQHVVLLYVLISWFGLVGAAIATLLRLTTDAVLLSSAVVRLMPDLRPILGAERVPAAMLAAGIGVAVAVAAGTLIPGLALRVAATAGLAVLGAAWTWRRGLLLEERDHVRRLIGLSAVAARGGD